MLYSAGPLLSANVHTGGQWTEEVRADQQAHGGRASKELRLVSDVGIRNQPKRKHRPHNRWPSGECGRVSRES